MLVGLKMGAAALAPVLLAFLLYLFDTKTKFGKLKNMHKQLIVGVVFGALACLATQFGIPYDNYMMNVRSAAPLTAGLVFGGPSGIIAGVIGGLYRWFSVYWGVPMYTRIACSLATVLAGVFAAICRKFMFNGKKTSWFYGVFLAIATEVVHMLLVFLTHMDDIMTAFAVVKKTAVPMIAANAVSLFMSLLFVSLVSKRRMRKEMPVGMTETAQKQDKGTRTITQTFSLHLLVSVFVAFVATIGFTYFLQDNVGNLEATDLLTININDVKSDISGTVNSEIEKKLKNVANNVEKNTTDFGEGAWDSENDLSRTKFLYGNLGNMTEIYYIDTNGDVIACSDEQYVRNFNLHDSEQSKAFLFLLDEPYNRLTFVQDYMPMGYDSTEYRKFAAIQLKNGGILQIAADKSSFQVLIRETMDSAATNRHIGQSGFIFIVNPDDKDKPIISAPEGTVSTDDVLTFTKTVSELENGKMLTYETADGTSYYYMKDVVEGYLVVACIPVSEADFSRDISVYIGAFMQLVVFFILFLVVFFLIKNIIIDNIHKINSSLAKITNGDLSTRVDVHENEEFASLSDDINTTVSRLKEYISEAEKRIDQELAYAKSIQHSALPSVFPPYPDRTEFDIYATMNTAKEVGGDFYDFYLLNNDRLAFLIADVSGKGIPAAMFMMTAKTMLKSYTETGIGVADVFTLANQKLCESNEAGMFVTAWMGILDLKSGVLKFANAGHNPPLIKHKDGSFEYLKSKPGLVLAGMDGIKYRENEMTLVPGDELFLYTDGVTEATDANTVLFGEENLKNTLDTCQNRTAKGRCDTVIDAVNAFVGEAPQFDDITMLSLRYQCSDEKGDEKNVKELTIEAKIENIEAVTEFVDNELELLDCSPRAMMQINVAIDELFGNIANYAYHPGHGPATVRVEVVEEPLSVVITFIDAGQPFDPLAKDDPDITASAEDREIGGLGIFMVKKTMDEVGYEYKDGKNILTIKKKLN